MIKPLRITTHCATVMSERLIDLAWVERTVRTPDWVVQDPSGPPTERRYGTVPEREHRILRVVCLENDVEIRIITAFLDRKARHPDEAEA